MTHVGYILSGYTNDGFVFRVPLSVTRDDARKLLNRNSTINGEPLSKFEFEAMRKFASEEIQVGWTSDLDYYLEGCNLPDNSDKWF